jgi:hypothetical protein
MKKAGGKDEIDLVGSEQRSRTSLKETSDEAEGGQQAAKLQPVGPWQKKKGTSSGTSSGASSRASSPGITGGAEIEILAPKPRRPTVE